MKIVSRLYSLAEIVAESPEWHFNVPIYQRLYVWSEVQVQTLLDDLVNSYERGEELFFLGGTLLVEQDGPSGRHFDLIDGQQRFTTLWLICHAWREALKPFPKVRGSTSTTEESRLRFAIRHEVNSFLQKLASGGEHRSTPNEEATKRMRVALDLMKSVFEKRLLPAGVTDRDAHLAGLTKFVFGKVKFVLTTVPLETDLNKLFEVINNRGVQLQHHEILKARMLDALTEIERGPYALMWEACADMENFIERTLSGMSRLSANEVATLHEQGELSNPSSVRTKLHEGIVSQHGQHALGLADILRWDAKAFGSEHVVSEEAAEPTWVRSIFGFPLFLQHTLRIWLLENSRADLPRLLDRDLLELFEPHFSHESLNRAEAVRSFIDLLWRLRIVFDEHIIKWADQGEEEVHLISAIGVSTGTGKRYISRSRQTDSHRGFCLLQSMLYHSQEITTQYWLTPLLLYIHRNPGLRTEQYFDYLRHLDNHLLGSAADDSLVVRTQAFMTHPWQRRALIHREELAKASGLKFAHYWFYKLEFVLWFREVRASDSWKKFRLTAKTSVEHISPQKPRETDINRVDQALDHFGNLALLSRNLNSEYGNLTYNQKRQRFIDNNRGRLDSLKMDLIYENTHWDDSKAFAHQQEMIACLDAYVSQTLETAHA